MTYVYQNRETEEVIERQFSIKDDIPVIVYEDSKPFHRLFTPPPIHFHGDWSTNRVINKDPITKWQRENLRRD